VKSTAKHVIFEAAHGYTANVPLETGLRPDVLVSWELDGQRLARAHGAPVRAVNPHAYFWKSPKWLTGLRFVTEDEPGYWEVRGYHNRADPWKEERYA
jgi:DMSO/TMAO reductase YedYZ molybdopterin-dependent catalytic subunit